MMHPKTKNRLIVRKGIEYIALKLEEIVLVYTENKLVFVVDNNGKKYMAEQTLAELETLLNQQLFFRANRQHLLNINYVRGFKAFEKVKLQVEIRLAEWKKEIIVSQENAPLFRRWIYEA